LVLLDRPDRARLQCLNHRVRLGLVVLRDQRHLPVQHRLVRLGLLGHLDQAVLVLRVRRLFLLGQVDPLDQVDRRLLRMCLRGLQEVLHHRCHRQVLLVREVLLATVGMVLALRRRKTEMVFRAFQAFQAHLAFLVFHVFLDFRVLQVSRACSMTNNCPCLAE